MNTLYSIGLGLTLAAAVSAAEPLRVAVLDFDNEAGAGPDAALAGGVTPAALAKKGMSVVGERLLGQEGFVLIDRRDFIARLEREKGNDPKAPQPSFLRAAQALNADVVLRGQLQGFSAAKQTLRQGGYDTEMTRLAVRVALEALDTHDGTVAAISTGTADTTVRQTKEMQTSFGEDDQVKLLEKAVDAALPALKTALARRAEAARQRPTVKISVKTSADPALVEIDGLLVGSTPLENYAVYQGDHTITIGRAGYRDVSKRVLLDRDSRIDVPMIRTELSADEIKQILEKVRMNMIIGEPGLTILPLQ